MKTMSKALRCNMILLKEVQNHPALYDFDNKLYKNNTLKNELWRKIGNYLKGDPRSCQNRYANIKKKLIIVKANLAKNKSIHKADRMLMECAAFIYDPSLAVVTRDVGEDTFEPYDDEESICEKFQAEDFEEEMDSSNRTEISSIDIKPDPMALNDLDFDNMSSMSSNVRENLKKEIDFEIIQKAKQPRDYTELFCLSLAGPLNTLPLLDRMKCQSDLLRILTEAVNKSNV